ncbi:LysR family transcriptional regulator [Ancylobacter amanitiformis]|uniref:Transposase n=1 Tax=Ancylobacter amanitiformis TaxID=217069 RepID=A0ABU0LW43_9HYPH|nr:LysR family transcriptional regulator [Ancylobacter amanitiformis]MDQ0512944.1 transposase [Ancylobacter amanitiformis]
MPHKIASHSALMAFEVAARYGSFARAADGLALTEGAISRQIGQLDGRAKNAFKAVVPHLRQALYFPAIAAARFNPDLKRKYKDLIAAGQEKKVALTAIMRKIIVIANALNWFGFAARCGIAARAP